MKIAYIADSYLPSKAANSIHVMKMCEAFSKGGHNVILFGLQSNKKILNHSEIYKYYGVSPIFKIKLRKLKILKGKLFLNGLIVLINLIRIRPDLIYGRSLIGIYLSKSIAKKIIFELHSTIWDGREIYRKMLVALLRNEHLDKLIVNSQALKNIVLSEFKFIKERKIVVARNGASPNYMLKVEDSNNKLKVGYFGNIYVGRGIELIIKCAKIMSSVEFHIVGGEKKEIMDKFQVNNITKNVKFHGHINPADVYKLTQEMSILLAPYQEYVEVKGGKNTVDYMCPIKIFEYMASSRAIICSDLPALREILNEENAILVPHDSLEAWINAINLLRDKDIRDKLGAKAYKDFQENYTWDKRAELVLA